MSINTHTYIHSIGKLFRLSRACSLQSMRSKRCRETARLCLCIYALIKRSSFQQCGATRTLPRVSTVIRVGTKSTATAGVIGRSIVQATLDKNTIASLSCLRL